MRNGSGFSGGRCVASRGAVAGTQAARDAARCGDMTLPAGPRATIMPSPASIAYAASTVPRAMPSWLARLRVDGSRAPGVSVPVTTASRSRSAICR